MTTEHKKLWHSKSQNKEFQNNLYNSPVVETSYFFLVGFRCGVEGRPEFIPL
jgi:hypothetical protein